MTLDTLYHAVLACTAQVTIAKAIQMYVLSNFEEAVVDWEDWDFDMDFGEFQVDPRFD